MSESGDEEMVVRVRGLPWSATAEEVLNFFDGVSIKSGSKGVHMTKSREGRPSGEAYIELDDPEEDLDKAMQKHNQHMGRRYIEVFKAKRSEMEWVLKKSNRRDPEDDCCIRLRGVPFGCSKEEIMHFFSGLHIVPNGIALPVDYQGKHTGEAYVQFVDTETAEKAMEKHKEKIAHRYIEIFKSDLSEIRYAMTPKIRRESMGAMFSTRAAPYDSRDRFGGPNRYGSGRGGGRGGGGGGGGGGNRSFNSNFNDYDDMGWGNNDYDSWSSRGGRGSNFGNKSGGYRDGGGSSSGHFVHMRGLPFRASEYDIADFFRPLNPININILMDNANRPSGEADVEFLTHEEAMKAMNKDKANMQHRYIELFLNSSPVSSPVGGNSGMGGGGGGGSLGMYGGRIGGNDNGFSGSFGGGTGGGIIGRRFGSGGSGLGGTGGAMGNSRTFRGNFGGHNQMGGNNYNSFC